MTPVAGRAARRAVTVRHEVTGTLRTVTALRVGGWAPTVIADLVVARDGLDRLVIPGTSLAGALRSWLGAVTGPDGTPLYGQADLARVFGEIGPGDQDGELCLIRVDDAVAVGEVQVGVRDGVGLDRGTGSAAPGLLYQHEVIPPGTNFQVRFTASQQPGDPQRVGLALDLIVGALSAGRVEIGAARTRGLGVVEMTGIRRTTVDLTDRTQVLDWLCGRLQPVSEPSPQDSQAPVPDGRLGIEIRWSPATPVMVRASTASAPDPAADHDVDTVPLRAVTGPDGQARLLLPGSSVKGVLRSHAERISRTMLRLAELPCDWLDQVNDGRLGPVGALFGLARAKGQVATGTDPGEADQENPSTEGRRGALAVHDCYAVSADERVVTHVAIDRWTGGSAENLLFSVREPATAAWGPIRMSLDVRRAGAGGSADDIGPALALLLLVLRDLADGWLTLGFGGTRGRGAITVSQVSFTGSGLPGPWASLAGRTLTDLIDDPPDAVNQAFATWAERTEP